MKANIVAPGSTEGEDDVGQYTSVSWTPAKLHRKLLSRLVWPWYQNPGTITENGNEQGHDSLPALLWGCLIHP